jgi:hypothetical protein
MTLIEVLDTAVKVGMGALISGVATYQVTRLNHVSDRRKEQSRRLHDALVYSTERLELYQSRLSMCLAALDGLARGGVPAGNFPPAQFKSYIEQDDRELISARVELAAALSRLRLIGERQCATCANALQDFENDLRSKVVFEEQLPSLDEISDFRSTFRDRRTALYDSLNAAYERINNH